MNKQITEGGFYVGRSERFDKGICPDLSRTIDTQGKNAVYVAGGGMSEIKLEQVADLGRYKNDQMNRVYSSNGLCPTIETISGGGREPKVKIMDTEQTICLNSKDENGKQPSTADRVYDSRGCSVAITSGWVQNVSNNAIIRKLTPRECWRLMGFDDKDFDAAQGAGVSNSQLYKQAGNSIVRQVLEAIFIQLF